MFSGGGQTSLSSLTDVGSKNKLSRIIRDFAGVASRSTKCAEFASVYKAPCRQSAFTLAEVLITLGIIGVVAAMTLPTVLNNIQNKELEAQFKKSYSIISQALLLMQNNEGYDVSSDNFSNTHAFMTAFKEYFLKYSSCEGISRCTSTQSRINEYKTFNSSKAIYTGYMDDANAIIGASMDVYTNADLTNNGFIMTIDINGINKKPNKWGHDLFSFQIINSKIVPVGMKGTQVFGDKDLTPEKYCSISSASNLNGFTCSARAFGEKDYFKKLPK